MEDHDDTGETNQNTSKNWAASATGTAVAACLLFALLAMPATAHASGSCLAISSPSPTMAATHVNHQYGHAWQHVEVHAYLATPVYVVHERTYIHVSLTCLS